jgi:hypothetical protein
MIPGEIGGADTKFRSQPPFVGEELPPFDWHALVDACVHELKVAIAEALDWVGEPLSAKELWMLLNLGRDDYHSVQYHARRLEELGLTEEAWQRDVRGATEIYYVPAVETGGQ